VIILIHGSILDIRRTRIAVRSRSLYPGSVARVGDYGSIPIRKGHFRTRAIGVVIIAKNHTTLRSVSIIGPLYLAKGHIGPELSGIEGIADAVQQTIRARGDTLIKVERLYLHRIIAGSRNLQDKFSIVGGRIEEQFIVGLRGLEKVCINVVTTG
jgi:hypothetical protein